MTPNKPTPCMGGQQVNTRTATGKLMLTMLGAIAAFERDLMLERQREGIAKAKGEGRYQGRAPTARRKADEVRALWAEGVPATAIADRLHIGRSSVYRIIEAIPGPDKKGLNRAVICHTLRAPTLGE